MAATVLKLSANTALNNITTLIIADNIRFFDLIIAILLLFSKKTSHINYILIYPANQYKIFSQNIGFI